MGGGRWVAVQTVIDEAGLAAALALAGRFVSPAALVPDEVAALREAHEQARREGGSDGQAPVVLRDLGGHPHVSMADPVTAAWKAGLDARVAELAAQAETAMEASRQTARSELDDFLAGL